MTSPDTRTDGPDQPDAALAAEEKPRLSLDIKVEKPSTCKRHVTITVPRADIERYFDEAFDELMPKAEVPGFRPGRAPRSVVQAKFKNRIKDQVKGNILLDSVTQAGEDENFAAISEPDFDYEAIELPDEGPMTFEFDIEVRPDFELPDWKGLEIETPVHEYTDEEVEQHLQGLLRRHSQLVSVDEPCREGDLIAVNAVFRHGDRELSRMEDEEVAVRPVLSLQDANLEGFAELISGAEVGEHRRTKIRIGDSAAEEELRGQEADVEFELLDVKRYAPPRLDAQFLDRIGGFKNEEELRSEVRAELVRQLAYYQQRQVRQQITAKLTAGAEWELPPELLKRQARRELQRAVLELQSAGFSEDQIRAHENGLRQDIIASTASALKEHFIFERIAEEEEIEAEEDDFDNEIERIANQTDESPRRVRARMEKRGQMDALRNQIIERKVIELILSHAEVKEVPFEPQRKEEDVSAVDHAVTGETMEDEIPEAKYAGGESEEYRPPVERE